uniref:Uncharacterized protein n=1 Tax=Oryza rufipogon TaxID=4529 RepID=A0A0E0PL71_ORYRU
MAWAGVAPRLGRRCAVMREVVPELEGRLCRRSWAASARRQGRPGSAARPRQERGCSRPTSGGWTGWHRRRRGKAQAVAAGALLMRDLQHLNTPSTQPDGDAQQQCRRIEHAIGLVVEAAAPAVETASSLVVEAAAERMQQRAAVAASMMVDEPDSCGDGGSGEQCWEAGGGDSFDDDQRAGGSGFDGDGWRAALGSGCQQWGLDRAKGNFVFLKFLSPLFDKK